MLISFLKTHKIPNLYTAVFYYLEILQDTEDNLRTSHSDFMSEDFKKWIIKKYQKEGKPSLIWDSKLYIKNRHSSGRLKKISCDTELAYWNIIEKYSIQLKQAV